MEMPDNSHNPLESILDRALERAFEEEGRSAQPQGPQPPLQTRQELPRQVGRYRIEGLLGCGGMGQVFLARDPELDRDLALKILPEHMAADPGRSLQFLHEARLCSQLQHPGVVPIHEVGQTEDGRPYFTMKILGGQTLHQRLQDRDHPLAERPACLAVLLKVCQTVAFAHRQGVLHRDIKSANVMLGAYGEVHLVDWGLACRLQDGSYEPQTGDNAGRIAGTPSHMSPEQANGLALTPRSDVFSLGAMLCEILTGAPPYVGETREEVFLRASRGWLEDTEKRITASEIHPDLARLLRDCLAKEPDARPADAQELSQRLEQFLADSESREREAELALARHEARRNEEHRSRRLRTTLLLVVAAGLLVSVWVYVQQQQRQHLLQRRDLVATQAALLEAQRLERTADLQTTPEPRRWQAARVAGRQLESFLASRDLPEETREAARATIERIDTGLRNARRDAVMLRWLQESSPHMADDRPAQQVEDAYRQRFATYGLHEPFDDPQTTATELRKSRIHTALAAGLDTWASHRRGHRIGSWKPLLHIALGTDPDPVRTRIRRAWLEDDLEALRRESTEERLRTQAPESLDLIARSLVALGDTKTALAVLRVGVEQHPDNFNLCHDLAALSMRRGVADAETLRLHSMACATRPDSPHALADMARSLIDLGRLRSAKKMLLRAREIDPEYVRTWLYLGMAEDLLGDRRAARQCMEEVLARIPQHRQGRYNLALLNRREVVDLPETKVALETILAEEPDNPGIRTLLAEVTLLRGDLDAAGKLADLALRQGYRDALNTLYQLAWIRGDLPAARRAAETLTRTPPAKADDWIRLSGVEQELGNWAHALAHMERASQLQKRRAEAVQAPLGIWLAKLRRAAAMAEREGPLADEGPQDAGMRVRVEVGRGAWQRALAVDYTSTYWGRDLQLGIILAAAAALREEPAPARRAEISDRATLALRMILDEFRTLAGAAEPSTEPVVLHSLRLLEDRRLAVLLDPTRNPDPSRARWEEAREDCAALHRQLVTRSREKTGK